MTLTVGSRSLGCVRSTCSPPCGNRCLTLNARPISPVRGAVHRSPGIRRRDGTYWSQPGCPPAPDGQLLVCWSGQSSSSVFSLSTHCQHSILRASYYAPRPSIRGSASDHSGECHLVRTCKYREGDHDKNAAQLEPRARNASPGWGGASSGYASSVGLSLTAHRLGLIAALGPEPVSVLYTYYVQGSPRPDPVVHWVSYAK